LVVKVGYPTKTKHISNEQGPFQKEISTSNHQISGKHVRYIYFSMTGQCHSSVLEKIIIPQTKEFLFIHPKFFPVALGSYILHFLVNLRHKSRLETNKVGPKTQVFSWS